MGWTNYQLLLLAALFILLVGGQEEAEESLPPPFLIVPGYDPASTVLEESDTLNLYCKTMYSALYWKRDPPCRRNCTNRVSISTTATFTGRESLVNLYRTSYDDSGFYYCTKHDANDTDLTRHDIVDRIYVFVGDANRRLMDIPDKTIVARENERVKLPCRPTNASYTVTLLHNGKPFHSNTTSDQLIQFDPREGFIVLAAIPKLAGRYECQVIGEDGKVEDSLALVLQVNSTNTEMLLPMPFLSSPNLTREVLYSAKQDRVTLKCEAVTSIESELVWSLPPHSDFQEHTSASRQQPLSNLGYILLVREISFVPNKTDDFTCIHKTNTVSNETSIHLRVLDHRPYMEMRLSGDLETEKELLPTDGINEVHWQVEVSSYPEPKLFVLKEKSILQEDKRATISSIGSNNYTVNLRLPIAEEESTGMYLVAATSVTHHAKEEFKLAIASTKVSSERDVKYFLLGNEYDISCRASGLSVDITWTKGADCFDESTDLEEKIEPCGSLCKRSSLTITAKNETCFGCVAKLQKHELNHTISIMLTDLPNEYANFFINSTEEVKSKEIVVGENITLLCGGLTTGYSMVTWWSTHESAIVNQETSQLSHRSVLSIPNAQKSHSEYYKCLLQSSQNLDPNGKQTIEGVTVNVNDSVPVAFNEKDNDVVSIEVGDAVNISCEAIGYPTPHVRLTKDGNNYSGENFVDNMLYIDAATDSDFGDYQCLAKNRLGSDAIRNVTLAKATPPREAFVIPIAVVASLLAIVLMSSLTYCYKVNRDKRERSRLEEEIQEAAKEHLEANLDPNLPVDLQTSCLPYNKAFEFSRDHLRLGKILGSGHFGEVYKAVGVGLIRGQKLTCVAVKTVKHYHDMAQVRALVSELKVMIHMGHHGNLVNVLGACTKDLRHHKLYVIVEYCRYGSLQSFLYRNRANFLDQRDSTGEIVDPKIGDHLLPIETDQKLAYEEPKGKHQYERMESINISDNNAGPNKNKNDNDGYDDVLVPDSDDPDIWIPEADQMLKDSNDDDQNPDGFYSRPVCTSDLLCWAFQVSRGMEYLGSKTIIHRDLAARNVLLTENNVVKICDFGLSREVDFYRKHGQGQMPIKWMALESLQSGAFNAKSDVWSYGVFLWELFTLGNIPYPEFDQATLYHRLVDGHRLSKPEFSTPGIYKCMQDCWIADPEHRPTFAELSDTFGKQIHSTVQKYYMDLGDNWNPAAALSHQQARKSASGECTLTIEPDMKPNKSDSRPKSTMNDYVKSKPAINTEVPAAAAEPQQDQNNHTETRL